MEYIQLCKLAYEPPVDVPNAEPIKYRDEIAGYIRKVGEVVTIFLKGTDSLADVFEDLNFEMTTFSTTKGNFGKVHRGFYDEFINLKTYLLRANLNHCSKIVITGHSMGGAIATLMGLYCAVIIRKPVEVYTFGSPKVGNTEFVNAFDKHVSKSKRYVNGEDPIPFLPNSCWYHHVKKGLYIEDGKIVKKDSWRGCCCIFDCCSGIVKDPIEDHHVDSYLDSLKALSHTFSSTTN